MTAFVDSLRDDAVAHAKRNMDGVVEDRHVAAALLSSSRVTELLGDESLPSPASVLGPVGSSTESPEVGPAAAETLERCTTPEDAAGELRSLLASLTPERGPTATDEQTDDRGADGLDDLPQPTNDDVVGPAPDLAVSLARLDSLIGLTGVKSEVHALTEVHRLNQARAERGLTTVPAGLHLVFSGNPGTGKTTVARLVAQIHRGLGLLPRGHLVEVQRADLVAGYVGQSALEVQQVIQRARGGVLFIDEAYSLVGTDNDDGPEVIATLLKSMEDLRDELAVIVAGYTREMDIFVRSNPGLRSRFQRTITFPDYSDGELLQIFDLLAAEHGIEVGVDVQRRLAELFAGSPPTARSGNGRLVRNVFEQMYGRMAVRVNSDGVIEDHELSAFHPEDVPPPSDDPGDARPGNYI